MRSVVRYALTGRRRSHKRHATHRLISTNNGTPIIGAIDIG